MFCIVTVCYEEVIICVDCPHKNLYRFEMKQYVAKRDESDAIDMKV